MGDIADMMLQGYLCATCGVALRGEAYDIPRYCKDCGPTDAPTTPKDLRHRKRRRTKKRGR
jgi:hypothetical protein